MWPFEHHEDGQSHLHIDNWSNFKRHKESGDEYPHNWLHRRLFVQLHSPRPTIREVPLPEPEEDNVWTIVWTGVTQLRRINQNRVINCVSADWSVIYEPYPAFVRTVHDKDGHSPSYHLWLEDKHPQPTYGEPVNLFCTGVNLTNVNENIFAFFRNSYWLVSEFKDYGMGTKRPHLDELQRVGTKKRLYRSIDD